MWESFQQIFKDIEKDFVPYKIKATLPNSKPKWWNNEIRDSLSNRNRTYKLWKSSPSE